MGFLIHSSLYVVLFSQFSLRGYLCDHFFAVYSFQFLLRDSFFEGLLYSSPFVVLSSRFSPRCSLFAVLSPLLSLCGSLIAVLFLCFSLTNLSSWFYSCGSIFLNLPCGFIFAEGFTSQFFLRGSLFAVFSSQFYSGVTICGYHFVTLSLLFSLLSSWCSLPDSSLWYSLCGSPFAVIFSRFCILGFIFIALFPLFYLCCSLFVVIFPLSFSL